jgi:hypothetical protein
MESFVVILSRLSSIDITVDDVTTDVTKRPKACDVIMSPRSLQQM